MQNLLLEATRIQGVLSTKKLKTINKGFLQSA